MRVASPDEVTAGEACAETDMHCLVCRQLLHMHSQHCPLWSLNGIAAQIRPDIMNRCRHSSGRDCRCSPVRFLRVPLLVQVFLVLGVQLLLNFLEGAAALAAEIAPGVHDSHPALPWPLFAAPAQAHAMAEDWCESL